MEIIKKHWPVIILSLVVGIVLILPTILSVRALEQGNFKGVYPLFSDDEDNYLALIREVNDGHIGLTNPYIQEYKSGPYLQPPLAELYYSGFAKIFHVSIPAGGVVNDFVLPVVSVLLLYFLFFRMSGSRNIALSLDALFFLFFISTFSRPLHPQFGFIFLLLGFHLIWTLLHSSHPLKKIIQYNIFLALVFGFLVYVYPFYWMTLAVVYGVASFIFALTDKNFSYWIKNWIAFLVPALIFTIPYLLNTYKLVTHPFFSETQLRFGFLGTRMPGAFTDIAIMCFCAIIIFIFQKISKDRKAIIFGWSLVASGVILNWQNIITAKTLQFPPHFYPIMVFFVFIISALFLPLFVTKKISKYTAVLLGLFGVIFLGLLWKQKGEVVYAWKNISSPKNISYIQTYVPALNWLNRDTRRDATVYTIGGEINWMIPVYTHNNVYFINNAGFSLMPDRELEERWVIEHFFDTVTEKDVQGNRDIWSNKFIDAYQNKETQRKIQELIFRKKLPDTILMDKSYIDRILFLDKKFKSLGFEKSLKTYKVEYVVLDTRDKKYEELDKKFATYKFLVLKTELSGIKIYEVK